MNITGTLKSIEEKLKKEEKIKINDEKRMEEINRKIFVYDCKIISNIISDEKNYELIVEGYEREISECKVLKLKFKQIFGEVVWDIAKKHFGTTESGKMIISRYYCDKTQPEPSINNIFVIKYKYECMHSNYELIIDNPLKKSYDFLFDKLIKFFENPLEVYDYPLIRDKDM